MFDPSHAGSPSVQVRIVQHLVVVSIRPTHYSRLEELKYQVKFEYYHLSSKSEQTAYLSVV